MKKNSQMQFVVGIAACLLGLLALPGQVSAVTLSGNVTTSQAFTNDEVYLQGMTNSASGDITLVLNSGFHWLEFVNTNQVGGNITATYIYAGGRFEGTTHNTVQTGGTINGGWMLDNNKGNYTLNGGTILVGTWLQTVARADTVFTQNGGYIQSEGASTTGTGGVDVGFQQNTGATGTMILSNGVLETSNFFVGRLQDGGSLNTPQNYNGVVVQEAGSSVLINGSRGWFYDYEGVTGYTPAAFEVSQPGADTVGALESSYTLKGGTLSIPNGKTRIWQYGQFGGYGTVSSSARELNNSGQVVADGFGVQQTLDLSSYGSVTNGVDNGTERTGAGWYAINGGKLTLPTLSLGSGNSTVLWGESQSDTTPDLVNSVKLQLNSVASGGNLSISLLSAGRGDVPASPDGRAFLGIWDFSTSGGFGFGGGNADLTFRFDDANNQGADLKLWHYDGAWTLLGSTFNDTDHTISTSGVNSFSIFAITVPEPSAAALFGLGGLLRWRRRS